jgi:hypothetical protein
MRLQSLREARMNAPTRCVSILVAAIAVAGPVIAGPDAAAPDTVVNESASALTEVECRAIWNVAAGRSDLGRDGAKPYTTAFESIDTNSDGKISNAEFKAGCKAGLVHKFRKQE